MARQQEQRIAEPQQDFHSGNLTVSAALIEPYRQFPQIMRMALEHGQRQGRFVFCTEQELVVTPERFGLGAGALQTYRESMERYGSFAHEEKTFIVSSSANSFGSVLRWMGLSGLLQELRISPKTWEQGVLNDLGLPSKGVPAHLVDELPLRTQYAPAIMRSLKANLGITCTPAMIDNQNPRYWVQMMALNAVAAGSTRTDMNETRAFYEKLLTKAQARMTEIEDANLTDGQILTRVFRHRAGEEKAKQPRFFTQDPQERNLLLHATRLIDTCLKRDESRYKFRCRLGSAKENYAITIVMGNGKDAPEEHVLQTHAQNLDQAVALKKALQSHLLNREGIEPLRYGYLEHSQELRQNEIIPMELLAPDKPELRGAFYMARFVAEEKLRDGSTQLVDIVFPLGVRNDPDKREQREQLAQKRLEWLKRELKVNDHNGRHETIDELTARMRKWVVDQSGQEAWKEHPCINLQGLEPGERLDLGFPRSIRGQSTTLSAVSIQYMGYDTHNAEGRMTASAEDSRNPSWHLKFVLTISDKNGEYRYQPVIKLQTDNEQAALRKAEKILGSLHQQCASMAGRNEDPYPQLRWQMDGAMQRGQIKLADNKGTLLPSPEPQYLSDLVEDVAMLVKSDFHIKAEQLTNDDMHFNLAVRRGHGPEQDGKPYKNMHNEPMTQSFIAADAQIMKAFSEAVNVSFRDAITETYSTRDSSGKRKPLQKFHDQTIDNLFRDAVSTQLDNPKFAGEVTQLQRASAVARQDRTGRSKE